MDQTQRDLYIEVMLKNYQNLSSADKTAIDPPGLLGESSAM